jgi:hypothetical protein
MEIGSLTRPGPSHTSPVARVAQVAAAAPVRAEMPAVAVEQAPAADRVQPDAPQPPAVDPGAIDRKLTIDPATQQVIYQAVDKLSGEVVRQVPDEALMRLRVYARALRQAESGVGADFYTSA